MHGIAVQYHRRSIRLREQHFTHAAYFVTVCTQDGALRFGSVVDGEMRLNDAGNAVRAEWDGLAERFRAVQFDAFVVMPNHVHGIFIVDVGAGLVPALDSGLVPALDSGLVPALDPDATTTDDGCTMGEGVTMGIGATTRFAPTSVADVVGAFKSLTTVAYIRGVRTFGWPRFRDRLWQRNYYERVIRDGDALNRMREYIARNPERWSTDRENPESHLTNR
jgi:putative transposase